MTGLGKLLIVFGAVLVGAGVLLLLFGKIPWVGRLPGDIAIQRPGFSIYVPLGTSLLLSVVLSLLLWLLRR